ncbi:MAG TPA: gamma-glutamyltransferase [Thermoanaerobaculia bacterium]|nr:gamma-glutamyltransferase [Thermoanaerobaculia bacterium]
MKRAAQAAAVLLLAASVHAGGTVTAKKAALSTAHPLATKAGLAVLQRGGTAADAAVTVALALAVVRPQSGNVGGGGFLTYYDAESRGVWTLDFRETAPRLATKDSLQTGGAAAGVPGTLAGLQALHERFGKRPWKELVQPAVLLAQDGPRDDAELAADVARAKATRKLELPEKLPPPALAATMQRIAEHGARDFYKGELAKKLVEDVKGAGGVIGHRDLADYKAVWRAPLKLNYGDFEIYSVPPPSGGGLVIGETLNILAADDLRAAGFQTPRSLYLLLEAYRRAYIDRYRYVADPAGARIPYRELLSRARGEQWRGTIAERVVPTRNLAEPRALIAEGAHTTHFTIADAHGNVVAFTTSLGDDFGSGVLAPSLGIFLNSANADFSTRPNDIGPGKRAASSLAPTIILRDGRPFLALGTSGGTAIPTTILQVFLNVVVHGKSLPVAVAAPRYHHAAIPDELVTERVRAPQPTTDALNAMGHGVVLRDGIGDVHAILFENARLVAVADPRRGGAAGGY